MKKIKVKVAGLNEPTPKEMQHEYHRILTMGKRISQRFKTIQNVQKMYAFFCALESLCDYDMARKAAARIEEMVN